MLGDNYLENNDSFNIEPFIVNKKHNKFKKCLVFGILVLSNMVSFSLGFLLNNIITKKENEIINDFSGSN
jgi:hypothetical protein